MTLEDVGPVEGEQGEGFLLIFLKHELFAS